MDQNQALLEYLLKISALSPEQEGVARQRAMADQLRQGGAMPGMRDSGKMVHAANPLEFLSSVANTGLGEYKNRQADTAQAAYGVKRREALDEYRRRVMPQPPEPPMGMAGAPVMGQPGY